jgi:hypothetical protein
MKMSDVFAAAESFGLMLSEVRQRGVRLVFDTSHSCDKFTDWVIIEHDLPIGFAHPSPDGNAIYMSW